VVGAVENVPEAGHDKTQRGLVPPGRPTGLSNREGRRIGDIFQLRQAFGDDLGRLNALVKVEYWTISR
jgi:hypothetical protein